MESIFKLTDLTFVFVQFLFDHEIYIPVYAIILRKSKVNRNVLVQHYFHGKPDNFKLCTLFFMIRWN